MLIHITIYYFIIPNDFNLISCNSYIVLEYDFIEIDKETF